MNIGELHRALGELAQGNHDIWKAIFDHADAKVAETAPNESDEEESDTAAAPQAESTEPASTVENVAAIPNGSATISAANVNKSEEVQSSTTTDTAASQ